MNNELFEGVTVKEAIKHVNECIAEVRTKNPNLTFSDETAARNRELAKQLVGFKYDGSGNIKNGLLEIPGFGYDGCEYNKVKEMEKLALKPKPNKKGGIPMDLII